MEQREITALALEEFGKYFPVHFFRNLTRKMHILSVIAPEQVRRNGNFYKYLKLEQETERAHHILNLLEVRFECVKNKAMKYFLMLQAFKNIQKTDLLVFSTFFIIKNISLIASEQMLFLFGKHKPLNMPHKIHLWLLSSHVWAVCNP